MLKLQKFIIIAIFVFISSIVSLANAESAKKDVVLFYDVSREIILSQKKNGDFEKGSEEFKKTLQKYYANRFNVIDVKPAIMVNDTLDLKKMLDASGNSMPIVIQIQILGSGTGTTTYRNGFGAVYNVVVPTVQMSYKELFGDRSSQSFRLADYGGSSYKAETGSTRLMGIYIKDNHRTLVKNGVKAYIYDVCTFNPPNKYTDPKSYNHYAGIFTGDRAVLSSLPLVSPQRSPSITAKVSTTDEQPPVATAKASTTNDSPKMLTMEQFNEIKSGMTYQQCVEILGTEGTLQSETVSTNLTIRIYLWKEQRRCITIGFTNDQVTTKHQIGLS